MGFTHVGERAFYGCTNVTKLTVGSHTNNFGTNAFGNCSGLTTVTWNASSCPDFTQSTRPFATCDNISSFTFDEYMYKIPAYLCYGMYKIKSITLPSINLSKIGDYAFDTCVGLTTLTIPKGVKSIGTHAFAYTSATTIYPKMTAPQTLTYGEYIFDGSYNSCKLIVPKGTLNSYKTTLPWSLFYNIMEEGGVPGDVNGDGHVTSADVTALYNWLLNNDNSNLVNGDQDGDGHVTSVDVTVVYNIMIDN